MIFGSWILRLLHSPKRPSSTCICRILWVCASRAMHHVILSSRVVGENLLALVRFSSCGRRRESLSFLSPTIILLDVEQTRDTQNVPGTWVPFGCLNISCNGSRFSCFVCRPASYSTRLNVPLWEHVFPRNAAGRYILTRCPRDFRRVETYCSINCCLTALTQF